MYVASALMALYAVAIGIWQPWKGWADVGYLMTGHVLSYAVMRSPWSKRLTDQQVLLWQIGFAVSATDFAYALGGIGRPALLVIFAMHIMFAMLTLSPRQTRAMGMATLGSILLTSVTMAVWRPQEFPWRLEALYMGIAFAILPVMQLAGVWVSRMRRDLSEQNEKLLEMTAKLEVLAQRDELTGLYNRRHMLSVMRAELKRAERTGRPVSAALLDLDHFKRINDRMGHQVGDHALRAFARAAGSGLRASDVLGRWGGEEFLLLLPEAPVPEAVSVINRIREELKRLAFQIDGVEVNVTFSAGLAQHEPGESIDQLLERADHMLYRAKERGRNRTELADSNFDA